MTTAHTKSEPMDAATLEALRGSIAKWERVVREGVSGKSWKDCPLCVKFWDGDCRGCPVKHKTGYDACQGSPFEEYVDAYEEHQFGSDMSASLIGKEPDVVLAAQAELDFLKSLLPPDARTDEKDVAP